MNSFYVRDGHTTVDQELEPIWDYLGRKETSTPAVLVGDAPYTSEFLHSYTGTLACTQPFLSFRHANDADVLFLVKAW